MSAMSVCLFSRGAVFALSLALNGLTNAKVVEEVLRVPVQVSNAYGKEVAQDIVVTLFYDDNATRPLPVLVLNHGRATEPEARAAFGRVSYTSNSRWFAALGFLVAVPTRIGYGETGGEDVEDSGTCSRKNYPPGYQAAVRQTLAVLEAVRGRQEAAKDRAVIVGQSFGGATAIAVAALNTSGVQAAINFAGGAGGNPKTRPQEPCGQPQLKRLFSAYGESARMPTLWVYTQNDMFYGPKLPQEWFEAFRASGGTGEFVRFPSHGDDGHSLFTRGPEVWRPRVLEFLRAAGYLHLSVGP